MVEFVKNLYATGFLKDIVIPLCVCVVAAFVPVIFNRGKLKSEQRFQVNKRYTEKRLEAILSIKKVIGKIDVMEIENLINPDHNERKADAIKDPIMFPQVMTNFRTLKNFYKEYRKVYAEQGEWVNRQAITYLFYGQKYYFMLLALLTDYGDLGFNDLSKRCQFVGMIVAPDLQKWQRNFDKILTKSLNKPSLKNYSKTNLLYKYYRNLRDEELQKTVLYRLLYSNKKPLEELQIIFQECKKETTKATLFQRKIKNICTRIVISIKCFFKALFFD